MNTLLKVSVAGALALGYVSAHAAAVVPSSSNPGDVFLFADVISGGSVIKAYAADTTVSINNTIGVTGTLTPGSTVYSADSNLSQLLALAASAGNTLQWAVIGGGGASDQSGTLQFVTTDTNTSLGTLTGKSGVNLGHWQSQFINTASLVNAATGANASVLANSATGAGGWDPTILTANASNWYSNGPTNLVTGLNTSAKLYSVTSPSSISTNLVTTSVLGNVELTSNGLIFNSAGGGGGTTTTPLPAAVWLLGSGLLGLAGVGRRKLKASA
jgi:hypothetical protein